MSGPIVRIGPNAVNVHDLTFYEEIFPPANRIRDRPSSAQYLSLTPESAFSTVHHGLHRKRRSSLNPFFSQRAINDLSETIYSHIEKLAKRLERSHDLEAVVKIETAYTALAIDIITDYCFGNSWNYLDVDDYNSTYRDAITQGFMNGMLLKWFPLLAKALFWTPDKILIKLDPSLAALLNPISEIRNQVATILAAQGGNVKGRRTIFSELLESDMPASEKTNSRLTDEAVVLVGAGADTTAKTLTHLTYQLIKNPTVLEKLRAELRTKVRPGERPSLSDLQQMPYLAAVVQEGVRLFGSQASVQTRICPTETLQYKGWKIPPGVEISEIPCALLHDETIFPEPAKLIPERWIGLSAEDRRLRTALLFGIGGRNCLGMNLAYAELYLTVAMIFTRFDLELVDTTQEHVKIKYYSINGIFDQALGGVKIRVKKVID